MTRIKFCGITRLDDLALAGELGVDAVGFVFWPGSPRALDVVAAARLIAALPVSVTPVGVFVRPTREDVTRAAEVAGIRIAQIHGTGDIGHLAGGQWHLWVGASIRSLPRALSTDRPPELSRGRPRADSSDGRPAMPRGDSRETGSLVPDVPDCVTVLLDAYDPDNYGGTGRTIDWEAAGHIASRRRVLLAGGLTPENVGEAIRRVRPYGVDVSSGIEDRPGIKSAAAMRAFVAAVRSEHERTEHGPT